MPRERVEWPKIKGTILLNPIVRKFQYGQHTVSIETGMIARQATAAVMVNMDDTAVFVTAVAQKKVKEGQDFFPLTVNYQERSYAAGRIPGSFFRREGRPGEGETLIARLIDRPLRPLFPEGFLNEIQIIATVVSVNPQVNPDIVAMIGASAALALSGVPFNGPIGAARVGFINDQYVLNPTADELKLSRLDLVVAGTESAVLMVESEADLLSEEQMLGAVVFGHDQQQIVIQEINELVKEAGKEKWDWQPEPVNQALRDKVAALAESRMGDAYRITEKQERYEQVDLIKEEVTAAIVAEDENVDVAEVADILANLENKLFVAVSFVVSHVLMVVKKTWFVRWMYALAFCHVLTVLRYLPVVKLRH
ncbi:Polyribonucleotide nucleotidyltransferase [Providencia stuartii]|nr:Polyribonucleotide nucleotidyltransferase [Providencia stuartii]